VTTAFIGLPFAVIKMF